MSPSSTVDGGQYNTKYLCIIRIDGASGIHGGTSVVYLEPARINQETETREIGQQVITICSQGSLG